MPFKKVAFLNLDMNKRGKRKYYTPKLINKIRGGGHAGKQ